MRRALLVALAACGGAQVHETRPADLALFLPATLESDRPQTGDPRPAKIRIWADAGVRAMPHWKEDLNDQLDYATQLLQPMLGIKLEIEAWKDWDRTGEPHAALDALIAADDGKDVAWVIGYTVALDTASKAMTELGDARPLDHHVIVHAWADKPETDLIVARLPSEIVEAQRTEVLGAHRRHKQTAVLLHQLATSLGAIDEADPVLLQAPLYSSKLHAFSDRNRELMQLAIDDRLGGGTDLSEATKLFEAIEKNDWGGWIPADKEQTVAALARVLDAGKAGKTASDIPEAAQAQFDRVKGLLKANDLGGALAELDNMIAAYPASATMHQLKCEIMLVKPGVADPRSKAACARVTELAPGDPTPHIAVGEAFAKANDFAGARAELVLAEAKIGNLPKGAPDAWRRLIGIYVGMGALTWTEDALAKAKLDNDPAGVLVAQIRARYGVPRGTKIVAPEHEAELVAAAKQALDLVYKNKHVEATHMLDAADKKWPNAPGLLAARCDLALRSGDSDGARGLCKRALAGDPRESWALYLSGVIALRDTSDAGARAGIDSLKKAIEIDPDLGQAWRALAKAYERIKDKTSLESLGKDYAAKFGQALPP